MIAVTVNGEEHFLDDDTSARALLARLQLPEKGIALAIDGSVFPKSRWDEPLGKGWQIEVLTAVQGG